MDSFIGIFKDVSTIRNTCFKGHLLKVVSVFKAKPHQYFKKQYRKSFFSAEYTIISNVKVCLHVPQFTKSTYIFYIKIILDMGHTESDLDNGDFK